MASSFHHPTILLLSVTAVTTALLASSAAAAAADADTTHLHFYMHDTLSEPNATTVRVVRGPPALADSNFGDLFVLDDPLTDGPVMSASKLVGRAQGFYLFDGIKDAAVLVSVNLALAANGPYNGSTVAVYGSYAVDAQVKELSVVGGSGLFRLARGYVLVKTYFHNTTTDDAVLELDVYFTTK